MICYDYINEYIRKTIKENSGILKEIEEYAALNNIPIVQPEVAKLLSIVARILKPERILEIGTAVGYSAILLAYALKPCGVLDTIEKDEEVFKIAQANIEKAGLKNIINIINGDALDVLKCLDKKYDMIFLDAAKGQYCEFLPECIRMLKRGGILFSDNVLYRGMVASDELVKRRKRTIVKRLREYLKTICSIPELETSVIPVGDGVAVSLKVI